MWLFGHKTVAGQERLRLSSRLNRMPAIAATDTFTLPTPSLSGTLFAKTKKKQKRMKKNHAKAAGEYDFAWP